MKKKVKKIRKVKNAYNKRKNKKLIIVISIFSIILLGVGIYFYIDSFKNDQKETKKMVMEVSENYTNFNKSVTGFVEKRNLFYKQKEELYLEEMSQNTENWVSFMADYEKIIESVETNSKKLKEMCKYNFGDINAKTKCNEFKVNYEAAMNYYITDIKVYNNIVKKYNEWSSTTKLNEVKLTIYDDYIDYDKDGEYFGKEASK